MHKPLNAPHNKRAWSSCLTELALSFLAMNVMYPSTKMSVVWNLGHTCESKSYHMWLSLKGNLGLFEASLMCSHGSSASHLGGGAQTWQEPNTGANCLLKCSDQIQMKFPTCKHLHGYWFFFFEYKLLHRIHFFICFALQELGIPIVNLQQRLCCFWTWRTIQKLVFPTDCSPKATFNIQKVPVVFFPSLKQNLI